MSGHEPYAELVVGYALDALEPGEEQQILEHLPGCAICQQFLADLREVAAHLALDVPDEETPAELLGRLRSAVAETPQEIEPDTVATLRDFADLPTARASAGRRELLRRSGSSRPRRRSGRPTRRIGAIAAGLVAALALAGVSMYAAETASDRDQKVTALRANQEVLSHLDSPGAYSVPLTSGNGASGAAVVDGRDVYLLAQELGRNDRKSSIYVLWAAQGTGPMVAVGSFDVVKKGSTVVHATLPDAVSAPQRFGVTHESGRVPPPVPGAVILSGAAA